MPRSTSDTGTRRPRKRARQEQLASLLGKPWAITPQGLEEVLAFAERHIGQPHAIDAKPSTNVEGSWSLSVRDRIAQLHIYGPLCSADSWLRWYGYASYEDIALEFDRAMSDGGIDDVVITMSSPGGHVHGCSELARIIYNARGTKRITAFVEGDACSAGYWLASACDEIVAADTAVLGCLGVQVAYLDASQYYEKLGLRDITITSSQTPEKNRTPTDDAGRAQYQQMVDDLAAVFLAEVARYRSVSVEDVQARFGQGAVLVGARAVQAGLADRIATYEQLHAELIARRTSPLSATTARRTPSSTNQEHAMRTKNAKARGRTTPSAAAFETSNEVRVLVTRDVGIAEGDLGTVSEIRDGTFYAVAIGEDATYLWVAEDELEAVTAASDDAGTDDDAGASDDEGNDDEEQASSDDEEDDEKPSSRRKPAPNALQRLITTAVRGERRRILGILKLRKSANMDALEKCAADPTCTPEAAAHRVLTGGASTKHAYAGKLAADEAALAAHGGAPNPNAGGSAAPQTDAERILATVRTHNPKALAK